MDEYCGSVFWDADSTQGQFPNFTSCFRNTVLVWIPCIFLWIFTPLEIYYIYASKARDIPYTFINISKMILITLIASLNLKEIPCTYSAPNASQIYVHNAVLNLVTFVLCLILTWGNMKKGIRSSGILFCFPLISVLCALPQLIHFLFRVSNGPEIKVDPIAYALYFVAITLILVLNCFSDPKPRYSLCEYNKKTCPVHGASFASQMLLLWFNQFISRNKQKPVKENLWSLDYEDSIMYFNKKYAKYLKDFRTNVTKIPGKKSVISLLLKIFAYNYFVVIFWSIISSMLLTIEPVIFSLIMSNLKDNNGTKSWVLYFYAFSFLLVGIIMSAISLKLFTSYSSVMIKIRSVLMSIIYKKVLRITDRARSKFASGEMVTLITADVQNVSEGARFLLYFWLIPIQLLTTLYYLWMMYGLSTIVTIVTLLLLIPINKYFIDITRKLSYKEKILKDERSKFLQDLLAGIKMLKMYAWEDSFLKKAAELRQKEYKNFTRIGHQQATIYEFFNLLPLFLSLMMFAIYIYWSKKLLDFEKAFLVIAFFNSLITPFRLFSVYVINVMQGYNSAKKIDEFLQLQELSDEIVSHDVTEDALIINKGTFSWTSPNGEPVLSDLNLKIPKGSMVFVVGPVGAGKSSLLAVFLGELYKITGYVNINGKTAYVPQQAWILNTNFKENITLGGNVDDTTYKKAIDACALNEDVQTFPAGDMTEIGEKGINLSGGQKQRINLARAICCNADIYFLDDPLSAVDFRVSKHIFDHVLGPNGLLRDKTRIFVTHNITFLPQSDQIIFLKDGKIENLGTFEEMKKTNDYISELILNGSDDVELMTRNLEQFPDETNTNELVLQNIETAAQVDNQASTRKEKPIETRKPDSTPVKANLIMKENVEGGSVKKNVYGYLINKLGIPLLLIIFCLDVIYQIFAFLNRFWLMIWVNANDRLDLNYSQTFYLIIFGGLGLMGELASCLTHTFVMSGIYRVSKIIYIELVEAVLRWPIWLLDSTPVGRIMNRSTTDTYILDDVAGKRLVAVLETANKYLIIILIVIYIAPITVIVFIFVFGILLVSQDLYAKLAVQLQRINANNKSPLSSFMVETLQGLHSIRANGYNKLFISQSHEKIDLYNSGAHALEINQRWFALRGNILSGLTISIVTFFILLESNASNIGFTCLALSYVIQSMNQLSWFFLYLLDLETAMINVERIKEFIDSPQEQYKSSSKSKIAENWPSLGQIKFIDYKLRYRKQNELVLKGLTFTIGNGEKIGIVGRTGAGKSSVIIGLLRMVEPDSGTISIDGVDITQIDLKILRSRLTLIPQDPILFQGTLRFNLDPDSKYSDANLWDALEKSHLKDYIKQLPQGLEYPIDEGGENLSCGQRQLICLARALMRKTKILLLDEATASVDLETDELIQNTIRKEFADCTVLTIAHRLNTIQDYEKILVLDDGNVVEYDSPNNLIESKNSVFYDIMRESGLI